MTRRARTSATGFLKDFQEFILRGNVIELAVAVIVGGAFGKIVDAFVTWLMSVALRPFAARSGVWGVASLTIAPRFWRIAFRRRARFLRLPMFSLTLMHAAWRPGW